MKKPTTFKKGKSKSYPVSDPSKGYSENILTPVTLSGVIAPWTEKLGSGRTSDFRLICRSGIEYFIIADDEWREVLSTYFWEEVSVVGLLNISNMTLIPQKVYPRGPTGENVIDLASWKRKEIVRRMFQKINDVVVIPAAVYTVMAT